MAHRADQAAGLDLVCRPWRGATMPAMTAAGAVVRLVPCRVLRPQGERRGRPASQRDHEDYKRTDA